MSTGSGHSSTTKTGQKLTAHFPHLFWLWPLTTEVQLSPSTPLIVPDSLRHLPIRHYVRQLCDVIEQYRHLMSRLTIVAFSLSKWLLWQPDHWMISCLKQTHSELSFPIIFSLLKQYKPSHLSQVQYKTVSHVETLPAHRNLCCPDDMPTLDLQEPQNLHIISHHMSEPWGHASFLWERKWCQLLLLRWEGWRSGGCFITSEQDPDHLEELKLFKSFNHLVIMDKQDLIFKHV